MDGEKRGRGRPRLYASDAERMAACRARKKILPQKERRERLEIRLSSEARYRLWLFSELGSASPSDVIEMLIMNAKEAPALDWSKIRGLKEQGAPADAVDAAWKGLLNKRKHLEPS